MLCRGFLQNTTYGTSLHQRMDRRCSSGSTHPEHLKTSSTTLPAATYQNMTPTHLAVHDARKCAIVWKSDSLNCARAQNLGRPETVITLHHCHALPGGRDEAEYSSCILYPIPSEKYTSRHNDRVATIETYLNMSRITATAFMCDGTWLKLFCPGSLDPYAMLRASHNADWPDPLRNHISYLREFFCIDSPFYGMHYQLQEANEEEGEEAKCGHSYLPLVAPSKHQKFHQPGIKAMYIFQSHNVQFSHTCDHEVDLDRSNTVFPYMIRKPVACLKGFPSEWQSTTMTSLERVVVSAGGSRIAIAMWDKILVYHINPDILCDSWLPPCVRVQDVEDAEEFEDLTT
jgi:hypothetical protein